MRLTILLFFSLLFFSCNQDPASRDSTSSDNELIGTFYEPITGHILFEIYSDSVGFKLQSIEFDESKRSNPLKMRTFEELKENWNGFCGDSLEHWMALVMGGEDWEDNLISGLVTDSPREQAVLFQVKEGYRSKEHIYETGFVFIAGSECFLWRQDRMNIKKLK